MQKIYGTSLNTGIFIGNALHIALPEPAIETGNIRQEEIPKEISRLQSSLSIVEEDINLELKTSNLQAQDAEIISAQREILRDPEIYNQIETAIRNKLQYATQAVSECFANIIKHFETMKIETFAVRAADYRDVAMRLLNALSGVRNTLKIKIEPNQIPVFIEIVPSLVSKLAQEGIKAYLVAKGSYNSHSSILCRALGLVAIANIPDLNVAVKNNDLLIVDGYTGLLIVNPDDQTLEYYRKKAEAERHRQEKLKQLKITDSITANGINIELFTNIGVPEELEVIKNLSCAGIGLFRTEFLYLGRQNLPDEEEQFYAYKNIAERVKNKPVIIRTIDIGGDKILPGIFEKKETNPFLGWRGIRFCLNRRDIFETQIKAILRASVYGEIKIMFPMVATLEEVIEGKKIIEDVKKKLKRENKKFKEIELGTMIEIPSAALISDKLAKEVDFFSIGSNDLIQFTLAVDRLNEKITHLYQPCHPSVLKMVKLTIENAEKNKIQVGICGEMASIPDIACLLVGMGIDELSMAPISIPLVKEKLINKKYQDLKEISEEVFKFNTNNEIINFLKEELK